MSENGGRPTDYDPKFSDIAADMCARGATIAELADRFGVVRSTIYLWMSTYQEFSDAIRVAREVADERVGFSLYERAHGYTYDAVKILQNQGVPLVVPYKEHIPPDVGAAKHWLANRQPEKWSKNSDGGGSGAAPNGARVVSEIEVARRLVHILSEALVQQKATKLIDADPSA